MHIAERRRIARMCLDDHLRIVPGSGPSELNCMRIAFHHGYLTFSSRAQQ